MLHCAFIFHSRARVEPFDFHALGFLDHKNMIIIPFEGFMVILKYCIYFRDQSLNSGAGALNRNVRMLFNFHISGSILLTDTITGQ